jgi:acetolactate decarboxylase
MKPVWRNCLGALLLLVAGCATPQLDTITQVSTIRALQAGAYGGSVTCAELRRHGDFGIGTFHRLDGEMVLLNGAFYQVKSSGRVERPGPAATAPFACVVSFLLDRVVVAPAGTDLPGLKRLVDRSLADPDLFYAVEVRGKFRRIKTRSVPAQVPPYRPLKDVLRKQQEFEFRNISGTLVGFRFPASAEGVNTPGYHFHFLSDDRQSGGHVLEVVVEEASVALDECDRFLLMLPK